MVRREFRELINRTSIRRAAKIAGITFGEAQSFNDGHRPQETTWAKLVRWFDKETWNGNIPPHVEKAIETLVEYAKGAQNPAGRMERLYDVSIRLVRKGL